MGARGTWDLGMQPQLVRLIPLVLIPQTRSRFKNKFTIDKAFLWSKKLWLR